MLTKQHYELLEKMSPYERTAQELGIDYDYCHAYFNIPNSDIKHCVQFLGGTKSMFITPFGESCLKEYHDTLRKEQIAEEERQKEKQYQAKVNKKNYRVALLALWVSIISLILTVYFKLWH